MALATQCPHCHTTFRVAHDQLKLRAGLVRCGACKQIFNGIENLLRPDAPSPAPASRADAALNETGPQAKPTPHLDTAGGSTGPSDTSASPTPTPLPESSTVPASSNDSASNTEIPDEAAEELPASEADKSPDQEKTDDLWWQPDSPSADDTSEEPTSADLPRSPLPQPPPSSPSQEGSGPDSGAEDPAWPMTLMDFSDREPNTEGLIPTPVPVDTNQPDPLDRAMEELERKPLRGSTSAAKEKDTEYSEAEEPGEIEVPRFVRQGRRRQRFGRALRTTMIVGAILLLPALLAQGAYVFRDHLAAHFPQTEPLLQQACGYFNCQVGLPAQIDEVSIESSELQTLAPNSNTFGLTVLLRNRSVVAQAWPHIELTLNDPGEKALVRRVFTPREYLPEQVNVRDGLPGQSEQAVRIFFELDDLKASGYRVYLFYP